ncbi:MAG: aminotransferase class I/II-fold pyridoxal phosphate-dependent enzyme [Clostridia bacterium]|nr:aminotransferase class I/II-fold pyridoxal phosphate-dependent enzyme [Clostridia bacterium]
MNTSFDTKLDRSGGISWLKDIFTPDQVRQAGLLSFAGAEFEFSTCPALIKAVQEAAGRGAFGYSIAGDAYRSAVTWWMQTVRHWAIDPAWIVPTHGTIFALATTIRLVTQPGESIIILTPGYNRYEQAATRLGRGTVRVPLTVEDARYAIDFPALENAMAQPENKVLVLCHPCNPTGHACTKAELEHIAALSARYGVTVFSDEIFADVAFGEAIVPYASVAGKDAQAITCTSLGKAFSLTGVNHANVIIENDELRERYITQRNADHYGSVDPMIHAALLGAYTPEGLAWLEDMKAYVQENLRVFTAYMKKRLPGVRITEPEGTFVVWVDYAGAGLSAADVEETIAGAGCFAGDEGPDYYGPDTCVRYSLAVPRGELIKALDHLDKALSVKGL